ncbi:MAG: hypothetical protein WA634_04235 [Silvibacterium sp.]
MKIFISHSANTPVSALLSLLNEEDAIIRGSFELAPGPNPMESIRTEIHSADAVIVVLDSDASNVLFELGIASGLRKPTLVLVKPGDSVPPFAAFTRYLTYTGSATEILKLGVEGFLGTLRPHKITKRPERQKQRVSSDQSITLPTLSEEIQRLRAQPQEQQLHSLVDSVLTSAGITSVQDDGDIRDSGVDFVVWSESLRGSFGNPVLIEVKGYLEGAQFQSAYLRLTKLVSESKSAAGVLLYLKKPDQSFERPHGWNPLVLWFDIEEFTAELLHRNFAEILVERRNLMVHGMQF